MAVSFGAAAFGITVPSIVKLLKYELFLDKKVRDGLASLQAELKSMHAFLGDVTSLAPDLKLGLHEKLQADEVSDLSHSIGTCLHSFLVRIESSKDAQILDASMLIINHEIDMYINDTRIKVKELRERHGRYPSKSSLESSCTEKLDPRILANYEPVPNPVGIAGAIADLTNMMSEGNHAMISIVGMGGIGKTTLAQAVYDKIKGDFDCGAFVLIGQRAGPVKVLKDIFDELQIEIYGKEPKQHQLANQLRSFLVDKRCLIVIDDIWDEETWKLIEFVCKDSAGTKIITTTRNRKFAEKFGGIYEVKPLSIDDSRKLLRTKAEAKSHDTEFDILSDKILHKCVGVPMAITVIGSFLAKKQRSEWNREYDSIGFDEHEENSAFEVITKMMRYSYIDLPYLVRNCFLYLSMFPKDHWIEKNMLIWRWVAEGLVPNQSFETGSSYLKELIDRSMLQWAVRPRDVGQGGCRVHSLMFDLIRDLSSSQEQNFSTVLDMKQDSTSRTRPIHRLAIHETILGQNQNTSLNVGEVKSFYASTCTGSNFPPLQNFKELRVIDLEACNLSDGDCKLEDLGSNCLEYVGLLGTSVAELPDEIGRLKLLQTLDVTATGIKELPSFVEKLRKLRCLRASKGTRMMGKVGKLTSLEELWLHSADKSPDFAAELRKLEELRVLVIHFDKMDNGMQEALVESLSVLKKLQVLQVWSNEEGKVRLGGWEGDTPFPNLRQLLLFGVSLPRLASWIRCSSVPKLTKLLLEVEVLKAQDLKILGEMSSLRSLYLHSKDNSLSYTAGRDEFKVLEYLNTNIELVCGDGALPRIQELEVGGIKVGTDVGLQGNMPLLERASYHLDCIGRLLVEIEKAEAALRQASQAHPNRPTLSIKRFNNYKIELEEHHRFIESEAQEFVSTLARAHLNPDIIPGLGGGGEAQTNAFVNVWNKIVQFKSDVGAPHVLAMGDETDGTGSPSQSAGGVPPRRPYGEGQVLLTTSSRFQSAKRFCTDELLADLKGQSAANLASTLAAQVGTEPAVVMGMLETWSRSPEIVATMNRMDANGSLSAPDISRMVQLMMPEIIFKLGGLGGPGNDSGTSARDSTTPTEELSDNSFNFDADSLLHRLDSLIADDAVPAHGSSLLANNAVPGITAKDAPADARKSLEKSMQNPEVVACIKSLQNADGTGSSASDISKLGKLAMADLSSSTDQKTDGPGRVQGAEANLAGKHPAENSGASISREPTPKVPCMHTQLDSVFSWLARPDGANFALKVADQFSRNPEMIASINSVVQNGDFLGMVPGLLSNPAFGSLLGNLVAQPSFMDALASSNATMAQGAATVTESSQDGANLSRMFNLKELLPAVQQALDAGESSGQPSSAQPDNIGTEEDGGE